MGERHRSRWLKIKQHPYATGIVVLLMLILFILSAYRFGWDWTGFNSGISQITITSPTKVNYAATISQPSKSLWDWLGLLATLAIPVVVGFGVAWFTSQQGKVADAENKDNQRENALQTYIDKISELLLHENLRQSKKEDEVRTIARVRTLRALSGLDGRRKGNLIQFLYESDLINHDLESVIILYDADLSGIDLKKANINYIYLCNTNLSGAVLSGAVMSGAVMGGADLSEANLEMATLAKAQLGMAMQPITNVPGFNQIRTKKTILRNANLSDANLFEADLAVADLSGANLSRANLTGVNLSMANLTGTILTGADLSRANMKDTIGITIEELEKQTQSLKGATMRDGSIHP